MLSLYIIVVQSGWELRIFVLISQVLNKAPSFLPFILRDSFANSLSGDFENGSCPQAPPHIEEGRHVFLQRLESQGTVDKK